MPRRKTEQNRPSGAVLLDTHAAIWLAEGNSKINASRASLNVAYQHDKIFISVISAWEIGMLVSKKRLNLSKEPVVWFEEFVKNFAVVVLEITPQIAIRSSFLPGSFHGDPADRLIVATALSGQATILTADKEILAYSRKGFVNAIAC